MIWIDPPEHLTEAEKIEWKKTSFKIFNSAMGLVKMLFLLCCGLFIYGLFGDHLNINSKPSFSQAEYEAIQRKKERAERLDSDRIENGIHLQTGLVYAEYFDIVRGNCTACHSAKLITQNRATREGWQQMIHWMQETQGLWDLGKNEPKILDYLAAHYAPKEVGRRKNIDVAAIEWYILNIEE